MKLLLVFVIILYGLNYGHSFLMFPATSYKVLDSFYKAILPPFIYEKNLMKRAIPGEECNRKCSSIGQKICYFKFTLEYYQILGGACNECLTGNHTDCFHPQCIVADGIPRNFLAVNRQLPGPAIQVCQNDIIVVDVNNEIDGMATTIHWHGILQKGTPYSDGVPFLTQCPIHSSSTFRYVFYANEYGTHFYHSHAGLHKANGLYGALIVRSEKDDGLYDFDEFHILCHDWMHEHAEEYFPGIVKKLPIVHSILINGHSRFLNKTTMQYTDAPLTVYNVQSDKSYRFRVINAAFNVCPFQLQIERHNFTIIASDGERMEPMTVDTLYFLPGERYDIIVNAIHKVRDYWIRVTTLFPCRNANTIEGFAVLRYQSNRPAVDGMGNVNVEFVSKIPPLWNETYGLGRVFNTPHLDLDEISVAEARSSGLDAGNVVQTPADQTFYLIFDTPIVDNEVLFTTNKAVKYMVASSLVNTNGLATINNISLTTSPFTMLSQRSMLDESAFCDSKNLKNCIGNSTSVCECIHRLKVKVGSVVELILVDMDDPFTHPFHLHGHKFYVMDMGVLNANLSVHEIIENGIERPKNVNKNPPLKDTIHIPNTGYARIKFKADNPGFWIGHCHYDFHLIVGMGVIFQVGELNEMKKPPNGFIECNNFLPNQI